MCTYCGSKNYRKIYEKHHGSIPKDEQGRSYDIHHIDGNRNNNDINNLRAVSILEHLSIHRNQKDWGAVMAISRRLQLSPEEISRLSRLTQQERVRKGIHHFLDGAASSVRNRKKVADGTHHFLDGSIQRKAALARFADGTHHLSDGTISKKNSGSQSCRGYS